MTNEAPSGCRSRRRDSTLRLAHGAAPDGSTCACPRARSRHAREKDMQVFCASGLHISDQGSTGQSFPRFMRDWSCGGMCHDSGRSAVLVFQACLSLPSTSVAECFLASHKMRDAGDRYQDVFRACDIGDAAIAPNVASCEASSVVSICFLQRLSGGFNPFALVFCFVPSSLWYFWREIL